MTDRYHRIYVGPTTAEAFDKLGKLSPNAEGRLIWAGTEYIHIHPAITRLELDLGGDYPFVVDLKRDGRR